jgi:steroid 5-alpha reductase family enzyme
MSHNQAHIHILKEGNCVTYLSNICGFLLVNPLFITLIVAVLAFGLLWIVSLFVKDCTWADAYWGVGFAIITGLYVVILKRYDTLTLLLASCVLLWGTRLSFHLTRRHFGKVEDPRYAAMRAYNGTHFWWKSLYKVFLLQAVLQWMLALPIHLVFLSTIQSPLPSPYGGVFMLGLCIFGLGLSLETVADWQLSRFRKNPQHKGSVMDKGLFAIVRYPHYSGEIVVWIGFTLMSFALSGYAWGVISPVIIALLLVKVSGVALTEPYMLAQKTDYADYRGRVPMLIPDMVKRLRKGHK